MIVASNYANAYAIAWRIHITEAAVAKHLVVHFLGLGITVNSYN